MTGIGRSAWDSLPVPVSSESPKTVGARIAAPAQAARGTLTPPTIVIKYNYSAQEVIHAHGKRLHRRRGSIRPAQDRAEGRGADRGPQPSGQAQRAERRHHPRDPGLFLQSA